VLFNLGDTSSRMGQEDDAVNYYLRGLELARNASNKQLAAFGSYSMGNVFKDQGRYGAAAGSQEEALKTYREIQDRSSAMADALNGYGQTLVMLGRYDDAEKNINDAMGLAREIKDNGNVSQSLNFQGERLLYAGDLKAARSQFDQALQIATRNKDRERILRAKMNLDKLSIQEGRGRELVGDLTRLGQEADSLGLRYLSAEAAVLRAEALLKSKDYRGAQSEAERALKPAEKSGFKFLMARDHYIQGEIFRASGKASESESRFRQARTIIQDMAQESKSDSFLKRADITAMLSAK
jgi:tetratricopeptide (TPR) repeat protein